MQSCPCLSRGESCCSSRTTATGTVRGWLVSGSGDPGVFLAHGGVRGCWAFCWAPLVCSGFLLYWRDTIAFLCPPLWLPAAPLLVGISLLWLCRTHGITFLWWARNPCLAPARPGRFLQKFHPPVRWPSFVGLHLGTAATGAGDRRVLVRGAAGQNGGRGLHAMERPRVTAGALSPSVPHPAWAGTLLWVRAAPVLMPPDWLGCSGPTGRQQEASDTAAASCQGSKTLL